MLDCLSLFLQLCVDWWIQGTCCELCLNSHRFMIHLWCYLVLFCNNKIPLYSVWWTPRAINYLINTIWVINPSFFFSLARWCIYSWAPRVALYISTQLCPAWGLFLPWSPQLLCLFVYLFVCLFPSSLWWGEGGIEKMYWVAGWRKK